MILPEYSSHELIARFERAKVEAEYLAQALEGSSRLLDIGCGPALTSILLYERLNLQHLFLMDGGPPGRRCSTWSDEPPVPWTDVALTHKIAKLNNVNYQLMDPDPEFTFDFVDAIISLLSWGHHYPVRVYLGLAKRSLPLGGKLVLDLRRERGGLRVLLDSGFRMIAQLDETEKLERYCFERVL